MAQFETDFSELPVDQQISSHADYTTQWATGAGEQHFARSGLTGETGGRYIAQESSVDDRRGVQYVPVPTTESILDVAIRGQYLAGSVVAGNNSPGIIVHGGGADGSEDGYRCHIEGATLEIASYVGGTSGGIASQAITAPADGAWFWIRFQVDTGNTLRAKYWLDGDPEPGTWDIDVADPGSLTSGWVGIYSFHGDDMTPVWDVLQVGTAGDPPSGGTSADPATLTATVNGDDVDLSCTASTDVNVDAYDWHHRSPPTGAAFDPANHATRLARTAGTTHTHVGPGVGEHEYQVFGVVQDLG